jgi:hypothetical protein
MSDERGKVGIVEISASATSPAVYLVEVCLDGETLTISDQAHTLTDAIRDLAAQLVAEVRTHYGSHDESH